MSESKGVTELLIDLSNGNQRAADEFLPIVYDELKRIARYYMRRERASHTLQATALVHETYLKLIDQRKVDWQNRSHFFGLASEIMRRILVNHARDRKAEKRGGEIQQVSLSIAVNEFKQKDVDILVLNEALEELEKFDKRKAKVVELKFFGGLTTKEICEVLQVSDATVEREWTFAKAWLFARMKNE
jgi:RNA polymerase sigma factor (TIGR02999 family)